MQLRVLVVESDPEELLFLEDLLAEVEEQPRRNPQWHRWVYLETLAASNWTEAATIVRRAHIDIILLNPNLSDSEGAATFRRLQALVSHIPVILLIEAADRDLGAHMIRLGAQDFVNKKDLDCALLAHTMQNAIERQRCLMAARATSTADPLTGLLNREAFLKIAERDRTLAETLGCRWLLTLGLLQSLPEARCVESQQIRDLALVEASESFRCLAGSTGLAARVSEARFALALFDTRDASLETTLARIAIASARQRIAIGAAIFKPDRPASLETLMQQAEAGLAPATLAMRR